MNINTQIRPTSDFPSVKPLESQRMDKTGIYLKYRKTKNFIQKIKCSPTTQTSSGAGLSGWYNPALNVYSYVMATWAEWQLVNVFSVTASRWNLETLWKRVRAQVHRGYESIFDATKILAEHVAAERYFLYFSVWWSYSLKHQTKQQPPHPPQKITK